MTTYSPPRTFLDKLVETLTTASVYNRNDQAPPAAILWPDKERQWEPLVPRLRERLPVFSLGPYSTEEQRGPAYWLRCIIARTISHAGFPEGTVPILYLPDFSRQDVRMVEVCPRELEPLIELQYRGVTWAQNNGRDWTIAAFIQNNAEGLGIEVGADSATREALRRSLLKLADESIETLRGESPIRAPFLDGLLQPAAAKNLLQWINDPAGFRSSSTEEEWAAFVALCQNRYQFHPEKDGPITAASHLGLREGQWDTVWRRFKEAPGSYKGVPDALRQARPAQLLPLTDYPESWPQENEKAEVALRVALLDLAKHDSHAARSAILDLEAEHAPRRSWVWATLGQTPVANALGHLAVVAKATSNSVNGDSVGDVVASYTDGGWKADQASLDTLAAVEAPEDVSAVQAVLLTVYGPWLEAAAMALQKAVSASDLGSGYSVTPPPNASEGTCFLFTDGLRYDIAQRLKEILEGRDFQCNLDAGLAALPTVTATAKPSISPAAEAFTGGGSSGLEPVSSKAGTKVTIEVLRKALQEMGIQVLRDDEQGDPSGCGWTEAGDIDSLGHSRGWRLAHELGVELRVLERRVQALLECGWKRVIIVTDHGWLLLPGGLPKAELPEHLTESRKGRCARLKEGAATDHQVVPWRWEPSIRIAVAPGSHCYEAGKDYEHGGLSPQECVVPMITVSRLSDGSQPITIESVNWRRLRCSVVLSDFSPGVLVDLRTKAGDSTSSLSGGGKETNPDKSVSLFVANEDYEGQAAIVVVVEPDGSIRAQTSTIVGGP